MHFAKNYGDYKGMPLEGVEAFVTRIVTTPTWISHHGQRHGPHPNKQAKVINLGMMYGMGVNKLSDQLDVSVDEAKALTQQYHKRVPFVRLDERRTEETGGPAVIGSVRSLRGRKCRFDLWEPDAFEMHKALPREEAIAAHGPTTRLRRAYTYKALNRLIQASAADMTKQAMVDVCEAGHVPMLQVHDELAFSVEQRPRSRSFQKSCRTPCRYKSLTNATWTTGQVGVRVKSLINLITMRRIV